MIYYEELNIRKPVGMYKNNNKLKLVTIFVDKTHLKCKPMRYDIIVLRKKSRPRQEAE